MNSLPASRILIVDDEEHNVRLLTRLLEKFAFHNTCGTSDSRQVESLVEQFAPDLVLLDLNMPGIGGLELLRKLAAKYTDPPLPVLILTGETSSDARRTALQNGASDFVTKPFDPVEVTARIKNLLHTRLLDQSLRQHNARLEQAVADRTRELVETQQEVLRRLCQAAEYRDDETGHHVARVSLYAAALGRACALPERVCELLQQATPLHDLGKIGIPDRILLKPGKLDPPEWDLMKTHAELGARILSGSPSELVQLAEQIALTHHERWDGRGYPRGLVGEAIPLVGRIVAICDVFDALTSERPYKRAWPAQEARDEIVRCAGSQFDPHLVECFQRVFADFLAIRAQVDQPADASAVA